MSRRLLYSVLLVLLLSIIVFPVVSGAAEVPDSAVDQSVYSQSLPANELGDVSPGGAKTTVRGYIDSDTTWTKAKSPYYMTGSVTVPEGVTLTIEPGVTVYFDDAAYSCDLKVWGNLVLKGTESDRIILQKSNEDITAEIILYNQNANNIEYVDCGVKLTLNGSNNNISNSSIGDFILQGDNNKLVNVSTASSSIGFASYYGFSIVGNRNEVSKCNLQVTGEGYYDFINGNYNSLSQSKVEFYGGYRYDSSYNRVYEHPTIKGNYNKIIINDFSYNYWSCSIVLANNNNCFHHNNLNYGVYLLTQHKGITNVTGNWFYKSAKDYVTGDNKNATPVYDPVVKNKMNIDEELELDEASPTLLAYTPSANSVPVSEKITLSVRVMDDSHIFGVFMVNDENSGLFTNNKFTYDEQKDTYTLDISFDKEGAYTLPMLALVDDYNNITYVDVTKYQNGKFNKSIVVGSVTLSSNANLKSLSVNSIPVTNFNAATTGYSLTLPSNTASDKLTVTAEAEDSTASVAVSGDTLVNNTATVQITVTAQDSSKKVYTVNVTKESTLPVLKGDVNSDGKITIMDAVKIARSLIGQETLTETQKSAADFNGDDRVTIMDAQKIALFIVGK